MVYWGRYPIETNKVRYEYNRPFLEAKAYQDGDAMAVEATGYALLTMFKVEGGGVTIIQDQVNLIFKKKPTNIVDYLTQRVP